MSRLRPGKTFVVAFAVLTGLTLLLLLAAAGWQDAPFMYHDW